MNLFKSCIAPAIVGAVAVLGGVTAAQADVLSFDDTSPTGVSVHTNGFLISSLTANGISLTEDDYDYSDRSTTFAKGTTINFSGAYDTFNPESGSKDWLFVSASDPTTVLAELAITYTTDQDSNVWVSGTYWGIGSGHAFTSVNVGDVQVLTVVGPVQYSASAIAANGIFVASLPVDVEAPAVPEPASWAMMLGGFGLVGGALRRRRVAVRFA